MTSTPRSGSTAQGATSPSVAWAGRQAVAFVDVCTARMRASPPRAGWHAVAADRSSERSSYRDPKQMRSPTSAGSGPGARRKAVARREVAGTRPEATGSPRQHHRRGRAPLPNGYRVLLDVEGRRAAPGRRTHTRCPRSRCASGRRAATTRRRGRVRRSRRRFADACRVGVGVMVERRAGALRPDDEVGLRRPPGPDVGGEPLGLADVAIRTSVMQRRRRSIPGPAIPAMTVRRFEHAGPPGGLASTGNVGSSPLRRAHDRDRDERATAARGRSRTVHAWRAASPRGRWRTRPAATGGRRTGQVVEVWLNARSPLSGSCRTYPAAQRLTATHISGRAASDLQRRGRRDASRR